MLVWLITVSLFVAIYVSLAIVTRPQVALGVVVPLTWLIPAWTAIDLGIGMLDVKTSITIIALAMYGFLPRAKFPWHLVPCDYAVLALVSVHLTSDYWNSGPQISSVAFAYVEWIAPYLAGRLAFQQREDISWAWPTVAIVAFALGCVAIFEAWTSFNPYETVFGLRPLAGVGRNATRWGFHRAYVTCFHPLYHGVLLCGLFGWLLYPAWRGLTGRSHIGWLFLLPIGMIAPLATGSRGPFLGTFVVLLASIFCYYKRFRWSIALVSVGLAVTFGLVQEPLLESLDKWSGESKVGRPAKNIVLDEKVETVSSARARLTLFRIFWTPLKRAGFLGYGTESVSTFPVNVPTGADEVEAMREIWSVDNTYILTTLRFGYLGLLSFLMIAATSLVQLIRVNDQASRSSHSVFIACLFGSIAAILVLIFTVWMPADFGFVLLWSFGASSGLYYFYVGPTASQASHRSSSHR